jgi:hypothetical protein
MAVEKCASEIIDGAGKRERDVVMTFRGKIGQWLKLVAPETVDRISIKAVKQGW